MPRALPKRSYAPRRITPRDSGFSLLECLLAILIVTFGLLGIMQLQANAILSAHNAKLRSDAGLLTNEMIGLMWADRGNIATYQLNQSATKPCATGATAGSNGTVNAWIGRVREALPNVDQYAPKITVGANNVVTVTVCWKTPRDDAPHNHSAVAQIQG